MASVTPVPVLCKLPLRAGVALCWLAFGAVLLYSCARGALAARQEFGCHGVFVQVHRWHGLWLMSPGQRCREELQKQKSQLSNDITAGPNLDLNPCPLLYQIDAEVLMLLQTLSSLFKSVHGEVKVTKQKKKVPGKQGLKCAAKKKLLRYLDTNARLAPL